MGGCVMNCPQNSAGCAQNCIQDNWDSAVASLVGCAQNNCAAPAPGF